MILRLVLFMFLAWFGPPASAAADWRTQVHTRPGRHPLPRPLTAQYNFGWSGLKAADATAHFKRVKGQAQMELTARTVGLARALWRMDSRGLSTVNAASLRPIKLTQTETYSRKSIDTIVDFTAKGPRRSRVITPPEEKLHKPKTFKVPQAHDLHSAFLFVRSQRLAKGDTIRLCVFPGSSPYFAEIIAGERETLRAAGKEWTAIACEIKLREIENDSALKPHEKFKRAKVWLSDDADRLLLRIEAEVYVGNIFAEISDVKFAGAAAASAKR